MEDLRPCLEKRRVPLLGLKASDHPDQLRARLHAVFLGQRAARFLPLVSVKVDSVVDQLHRGSDSAFLGDLALDGLRYRDLARGGPGREQDYARLKPRAIQARKQRVQVLLRAAAAPRGEDLDDTHLGPPGQGRQHERLDAGIRRWSGLERRAGGGQSQIAVRRTRTRWSGSSTAPHSYL